MNNDGHKRDPRSRKLTRVGRRGLAPLAAGTLIVIAAMSLLPCRKESRAAETAPPAPKDDLQRILGVKDAAVERADRQYAEWVSSADKSYEQSLSKARTFWSRKIDDAKSVAVTDLKALGTRLAAAGQLGETVKVLKAVYTIEPQDNDTAKALTAAGVDLTTIPPEMDYVSRRDGGSGASKIVIWNTHNARYNTSGALQCNVALFQAGKPIWRADKVDLPWRRDTDTFAVVNVPARQFDLVRVEITKWRGYSGGLAEIEIWRGGKNIALGKPTRASAAVCMRTTSARVTDGITTSTVYKDGYWLLPDNRAGWVEISLGRPAYRRLLRAKISARKSWQKTIEVAAGDIIDITAGGKWRASPRIVAGPDGGVDPGGDQWGKFRDRFYLQGRLGDEEKTFKIGSRFTLRATQAGHLELSMNEEKPEWYGNNSGFLEVTLSVRKRPPASESSGANIVTTRRSAAGSR